MTPNPIPKTKPGAPVPPAGKQAKQKKPKKPMPRFLVAALSVIITLFLIAGAGVALYLNTAGLAQQVIEMLPQYKVAFDELDRMGKDIEARKAQLQVNESKLEADAKANASAYEKQAADLAAREAKLAEDQKALQDQTAEAESEAARKKKAVDIYTKLDPSTAAGMLDAATTLQEVAAVLNELPTDMTAEILAAMDPKKAYDVLKLMNQ